MILLAMPVVVENASADNNLKQEVNVYSARKEQLIAPLLKRFEAETGIQVNLLTGDADALLKRLQSEGSSSPADLLITTDAARLYRAEVAGVLAPVQSKVLETVIPANLRHPEGLWFGMTYRARPIMYVKGRVDPAKLATYEGLADPEWKGRICIRSSNNVYNQSLVAALIATRGAEAVQQWANRFVANFARKPQGGDRDQVMAAAAGQCDIAIANTYYLAQMIAGNDPAQRDAAQKVGVFWPNQVDRGTHINISGIALTQSSRNRPQAIELMEYMVTEAAQQWYAEVNQEYPVRKAVAKSAILSQWGDFLADPVNLSSLGKHNPEAVRIMDRAGWQ
jgi:iron(III) transport system substrate-binding protein